MEYNLQKTIDSNLGYLFPTRSAHYEMTAFPSVDFINPGIGNSARIHSIYVPIHSNNPYDIKKTDQALEMEGKGNEEIDNAKETNDIDMEKNAIDKEKNAMNPDKPESEIEEDPIQFNERKRKRLGEGIYQSFQHAKIETGMVDLKALKKSDNDPDNVQLKKKPKISKKNLTHKFSISDN